MKTIFSLALLFAASFMAAADLGKDTLIAQDPIMVQILKSGPSLANDGVTVQFSFVSKDEQYTPVKLLWYFFDYGPRSAPMQAIGDPVDHRFTHAGVTHVLLVTINKGGLQRNFHTFVKVNPPAEVVGPREVEGGTSP